jgi:DNA processing protein
VTSVQLTPGHLPRRLQALGWRTDLRVRGTLCDGPAIAIVGARAATRVAMDRAHALARHLAAGGTHVVSGGALGIDGAAHRGALAAGKAGAGTTVVLGSGLDRPYPERHAPLFRAVLAAGGALVSQLADHVEPRRATFVARNPLISALADAVIVVEAEAHSGSLHTARAALKQGRLVAAWPGSRGCDRLLALGVAAVVEGVADVDALVAGRPRLPAPRVLDPIARRVLDAVTGGAVGVDAICAATGLGVREVLRALPRVESSLPARKS